MIQLGDKVRDRLTGFEGVVIGITEWLYQCRRPIVQPTKLTSDGKLADTQAFDESQLEVVERAAFGPRATTSAPESKTGGPRDIPTRRADPGRR